MKQTLKDHKPPPNIATRLICRAKSDQSPNGPLAELVGDLLDPFIKEADLGDRTEVISTEELCHDIKMTNEKILRAGLGESLFQQDGKIVVGSMDAEKLYPNLDIGQVAEEVKQEIIDSPVEVKGVDPNKVALFLAYSMSQEEIDAENLTQVVNTRRAKKGTRPGLTSPAITGGPKVRSEDTSWLPASRQPSAIELKKMIGCLIKCAVKLVMNNHF